MFQRTLESDADLYGIELANSTQGALLLLKDQTVIPDVLVGIEEIPTLATLAFFTSLSIYMFERLFYEKNNHSGASQLFLALAPATGTYVTNYLIQKQTPQPKDSHLQTMNYARTYVIQEYAKQNGWEQKPEGHYVKPLPV